jgi:hypothetical protein
MLPLLSRIYLNVMLRWELNSKNPKYENGWKLWCLICLFPFWHYYNPPTTMVNNKSFKVLIFMVIWTWFYQIISQEHVQTVAVLGNNGLFCWGWLLPGFIPMFICGGPPMFPIGPIIDILKQNTSKIKSWWPISLGRPRSIALCGIAGYKTRCEYKVSQ